MPDKPHDLPNFRQALKKYSNTLTYGSRWRYGRGMFPLFGEFLLENPELIIALAIDASLLKSRQLAGQLGETSPDSQNNA